MQPGAGSDFFTGRLIDVWLTFLKVISGIFNGTVKIVGIQKLFDGVIVELWKIAWTKLTFFQ